MRTPTTLSVPDLQKRQTPTTLVIGFPIPTQSAFYLGLYDTMRMAVDDVQAQGILSGAVVNISMDETGDNRGRVVSAVVNYITTKRAIGIVSPGSRTSDIAWMSSLYNVPTLENSVSYVDIAHDSVPSLITTIPSRFEWLDQVVKFMRTQKWAVVTLIGVLPDGTDPTFFSNLALSVETAGIDVLEFFSIIQTSATNSTESSNPDTIVVPTETPPPGFAVTTYLRADATQTEWNNVFDSITKSILKNRGAVTVYMGAARRFVEMIRVVRSLDALIAERVWIVPGAVLDYVMGLTDLDLPDLMEGVIVIREQEGQGPVYDEVVKRVGTAVASTTDELMSYGIPSLQKLLSNTSTTVADLANGYLGAVIYKMRVPQDYQMPDLMTVTGPAVFGSMWGERVGSYNLVYLSSTKSPVAFGSIVLDGSVNLTAPIVFRQGLTTPPPALIPGPPPPFDWAAKILAPVLVCVAILLFLVGCLLWEKRRRRQKRELELLTKKAKGLVVAPKLEVNAPAQKAIDLLKSIQTKRKNTFSPQDIEFLLGVLASGEGGFALDLNHIRFTGGAKIDEDTRAYINDTVLGSRRTGSHPYSDRSNSAQPGTWPAIVPGPAVSRGSSETSSQHQSGPLFQTTSAFLPGTSTVLPPNQFLTRQLSSDLSSDSAHASGSHLPALPSFTSPKPSDRDIRKMSVTRPRGETSFSSSDHQMLPAASLYASGYLATDHRPSHDMTPHPIKGLDGLDVNKIRDYLDLWYHSWNFDMFYFNEMTGGHSLYFSALYAFQASGVLAQFQVDLNKFKHWILLIESNYHPHPYHNAIHAADVLHGLGYLVLEDPMGQTFTPLETIAGMLAAVGHDIDHPGFNNNFIVKSHHPLALLYSDTSVLEFHHAAHFFRISHKSPHNIFADFTAEEYEEIRKIIIRLILATDMAKHFEYLSRFRSKLTASTPSSISLPTPPSFTAAMPTTPPSTSPALPLSNADNRLTILEMGMKCADLANPSKTFALSSKWTEVIMEEFFRQGDRERQMGLAISQFGDRGNTNVGKCQIGFIDFLVAPMYDAWNLFNRNSEKTSRMHTEILKNRAKWVGLSASAQFSQQQQQQSSHNHQQPPLPSGLPESQQPSTTTTEENISKERHSRSKVGGRSGLGELAMGLVGSLKETREFFGGKESETRGSESRKSKS
ncbi:High affinity cAMP-specific 3',5'-cyclic phosphodiesterase 7A, partial [Rhizophlyctis rosea]